MTADRGGAARVGHETLPQLPGIGLPHQRQMAGFCFSRKARRLQDRVGRETIALSPEPDLAPRNSVKSTEKEIHMRKHVFIVATSAFILAGGATFVLVVR
jgi:hypothetical protein